MKEFIKKKITWKPNQLILKTKTYKANSLEKNKTKQKRKKFISTLKK